MFFDRFKIGTMPTVMIFDPDGSEVDWILGYEPPADKYQSRLEAILQGTDTFKALSAAYAKDPKDLSTVFKLARKWADRTDAEKASAKYKEVLALDPEGKLGTTEYRGEKYPYTEAAEFNLGLSAIGTRRGKSDPAPLLAFIKKYPESGMVKEAYDRLASAYFGRSAPKTEAAKFFEDYTGRYPADSTALSAWVRRIIADKEPLDNGLQLAQKAVELAQGPDKTNAFQNLAQIYLLMGEKAKAAETAETLIKTEQERLKNPDAGRPAMMMGGGAPSAGSATYLLSAARIFIDAGRMERALAVFGPEFLAGHMNDAGVLLGYAQFWMGQATNLDGALTAAKKSVELSPDGYRNWLTLSQIQLKLKNYDEALKAADKAMAAAPAQPAQIKDTIKKTIDQIKAEMADKK